MVERAGSWKAKEFIRQNEFAYPNTFSNSRGGTFSYLLPSYLLLDHTRLF